MVCSMRALATGSILVGTSRGRKDWWAAWKKTEAEPTPKTRTASSGMVRGPVSASAPIRPNRTALRVSAAISTGRRRTRSMSTPASRPRASAGSHWAERTTPSAVWSAPNVWISRNWMASPEENVPSQEPVSATQSRMNAGYARIPTRPWSSETPAARGLVVCLVQR